MAKEEWDQGRYAMECDDYATAVACFRRAIKIAGVGGEPFLSFKVCYETGLGLLCKALRELDDNDGGDGCLRSITAIPCIANVSAGDESDLELAHKMFNAAWVIAQKNPDDTMDKVDVLKSLSKVSGTKGDFDTAFDRTLDALFIAERLFESEPDNYEYIITPNLSLGYLQCWRYKFQEGSEYFQKSLSLLQARLQRQDERLERDYEMRWRRLARLEREAEKQWLLEHPDSDDEDLLSGDEELRLSSDDDAHILSDAERRAAFSDRLYLESYIPLIERKLEDIRQELSNSESRVAAADAMSSSRMDGSKNVDPPTASTAHTSHLRSIRKGVKRSSSDTHLGEPLMKIPAMEM